MDIELLEIRDFLGAHHPFDQLSEEALSTIPSKLEIRYLRRDAKLTFLGNMEDHLYIIRTGAIELHDQNDHLHARLAEGDVFGYRASHLEGLKDLYGAAIEDCLLYQLNAADVDILCSEHSQLAYFFEPHGASRLREAISQTSEEGSAQLNLMATQLEDIINREPITMPPDASIRDVAQIMSQKKVSSMLITARDQLAGIVTDRDIRNRVVADGLDYNLPIAEIMTLNPTVLDKRAYAFEAILLMAQKNIHHLPIVDGDKAAGMLTATDLTQRHTTSAVHLVGAIYKQDDIEELKNICSKTPQLLLHMAAADATANSVGHVVTAITDALTSRLLQLAEKKLGPPPIPYAWVAAGSQARSEQTAKTDQDNCLILDNSFEEAKHGEYFTLLTRFVCDGLNHCGYIYCPGEMMAITDKWRQPLNTWKDYFSKWTNEPEPKALMLTCVFFDMRCIYGESRLFRDLRQHMLDKTRGNRIFLAFMVGNALKHRPPLGFFRNFVLIHDGEHDHTFDLKHSAIVPIVDLARVYALAAGIEATNTMDRLDLVSVKVLEIYMTHWNLSGHCA